MRRDPATAGVARLSRDGDCSLYSIDWSSRARTLVDTVVGVAGSVLDARGTSKNWRLRVLFPDRETASETYQSWCSDDIRITLSRIHNLSGNGDGCSGLSSKQHSAIVTAFETDYYDVPRGTTLEELATNFDVSHQALSECLRRGHSNLVEMMVSGSTVAAERSQ
jgi:predicted DNA binding protein